MTLFLDEPFLGIIFNLLGKSCLSAIYYEHPNDKLACSHKKEILSTAISNLINGDVKDKLVKANAELYLNSLEKFSKITLEAVDSLDHSTYISLLTQSLEMQLDYNRFKTKSFVTSENQSICKAL